MKIIIKKQDKIRRKYEEKLTQRLEIGNNKKFLIEKLQAEWENIEKQAKREQMIAKAKIGGMVMGKAILCLLMMGGILTIIAVAPNMFAAFGRLAKGRQIRRGFFDKKTFHKTKNYLLRQNYIHFSQQNDGTSIIEISEKGEKHALSIIFNDLKIPKLETWDRFWRIVIFDIPEKHRWARGGFRDRLKLLGFYQLQKSAFVIPYPCEDEVKLLISVFNINLYVHFIKTQHLEDDQKLKKYFDLTS